MPYLMNRLKEAGMGTGPSVLDAGCGYGRFARYLAQLTYTKEIMGVDSEFASIKIARDKSPGRALEKLSFQDIDIDDYLKKNRKKFDIIGAFNLLEYVKKPKDILRKLITATRTKGFLVGSVYLGDDLPFAKNSWVSAEAFVEEFPKLTIVDMKNGNTDCIVFMYQKTTGPKV